MHEFVAAWGPASIKNDIWVGLRKKIHLQVFDTDPSLFQPLQEDWLEEFAYTDGIRFNKGINDKLPILECPMFLKDLAYNVLYL